MIARSTIDAVFEAARVEEVIGEFVQLKKAGSNFKGLSPFTDEKTPSFMVSPAKQIWKDFSSSKGGNVVSFLMEHEHFSYPEAIRFLAKRYGIEIEETQQTDEEKQEAGLRESLYLTTEYAKDFFHRTLRETKEGKSIGLSYFKERGFSPETIATFQLGYSPEAWEALTGAALKDGYQLEFLEKTGLTIVKEEKKFDRFRGRVIFPIFSMSGRTLGFGGRILKSDAKTAKYLNSPESDIYHKSKVLYGLYHAKQAIAKADNCYLTEGYTDVIQLYQAGIQNAVSSSGTALTTEQIRLISRLTKNITLLFDGDAAGLQAAIRGVDLILEEGMNVRICTFPSGEDPDSFAKKHALPEITEYLASHTEDFINFKASLLAEESADDPLKKAETIRQIVASISKIPDTIKRELYLKKCAGIMDVSEEALFSALAQILAKNRKAAARAAQRDEKPFEVARPATEKIDVQAHLEKNILEMLLLYGREEAEFEEKYEKMDETGDFVLEKEQATSTVFKKIYLSLQEDEIEFADPLFRELYTDLINRLLSDESFVPDQDYIKKLEGEQSQLATAIIMEEEKYQLHDWERKDIFVKSKTDSIPLMLDQIVLNLRKLLIASKIDQLASDIKTKDDGGRLETMQAIKEYKELETNISHELETVVRRLN